MPIPRRPRVLPILRALIVALVWCLAGASAAGATDRAGEPAGEWPLDPRPTVVRGFAPPAERWHSGHRGVDLAGRAGQVVRSALPGTVTFAGRVGSKAVVVVTHGRRRTTYEPVVALVATGDRVDAGEAVGRLQVAGSHCFPAACLHWGLLESRTYLDPLQLVGAGPVRLLPLAVARP